MITVNYVGYNVSESNHTRIYRPKGSGDYLFLFFLSGMHIVTDNVLDIAYPGGCMIYMPGEAQDYSAIRDFRASFVHFEMPAEEFDQYELPLGHIFYPKHGEIIQDLIMRIQSEYYTKEPYCETALSGLMSDLLIRIAREEHEKNVELTLDKPLFNLFCQARYTMLSNCEREWASTNMSQMVSLSRSQFYKYYNDFFGISPMQDLTNARIEKAKYLLMNKELSVTDVSARCGYASIHHFSRTFKEHTGVSPLQYIRDRSKNALPEEEI